MQGFRWLRRVLSAVKSKFPPSDRGTWYRRCDAIQGAGKGSETELRNPYRLARGSSPQNSRYWLKLSTMIQTEKVDVESSVPASVAASTTPAVGTTSMPERSVSLLIVEDDPDFRDTCARWLERKGYRVAKAASGAEALALCQQQGFDVAVFDMNMPGMSGMELLQRVREANYDMEVIFLTGQGTIESAVQAMKFGACDYLTKPCPMTDLAHHCQLAYERGCLRRDNDRLREIIRRHRPDTKIIGTSPEMRTMLRVVERVAPTDKTALILGESGTGKELVACAIHQASTRANMPFVTINCAALPEQLVESELFGHQKGSFTGATTEKQGLFEIADRGTLFIDEIGELPLSLQPKLLRVLEDGSMRRVGSHQERVVDVRIIAATNRDLSKEVAAGNFREDLYYRINVVPVELPPLRERGDDVQLLIDAFMPKGWTMEPSAREALVKYDWPGNVRQLINVMERATILADGKEIKLQDLPREISHIVPCRTAMVHSVSTGGDAAGTANANVDRLDDIAMSHVLAVLQRENGNKAKAARVLGIHRRKLYRLLDRYHSQASAPHS